MKHVFIPTCDCNDRAWHEEDLGECEECGEPCLVFSRADSPSQFQVECWWAAAPDGIKGAGPFDSEEQVEAWKEISPEEYKDWVALPLYRKHK